MTASSSAGSSHRAVALLGPTASGKSALALQLARALQAEIISVDAGAVYCDMDIGTATPTADMRTQVPHHLINITTPPEGYNVGRFVRDAARAMAEVRARGNTPLFVGGTMMYFHALFEGLSAHPPVPAEITRAVRAQAAQAGGLQELYAELQGMDAAAARTLPANDAQRITRAVALRRSGWQPDSSAEAQTPLLQDAAVLLLHPADRTQLRQRIRTRLEQMWQDGLLEETQHLIKKWHLPADAPALKLAGYQQAAAHLRREMDADTMKEKAYTATSQLAKRQFTWMKKWHAQAAAVLDPLAMREEELAAAAMEILQK